MLVVETVVRIRRERAARSWHGWHRHVAMVMLAFAMTPAIRYHANLPTPPKTKVWIKRLLQKS
jgi:SRSO17 transposase